jgi:putative hydrolase of the HAD superfamily
MKTTKTIVFDLDDTLAPEIEFLESAFKEISSQIDVNNNKLFSQMLMQYHNKENVFQNLQKQYQNISISQLLDIYRNHIPHYKEKTKIKIKKLLLDLKAKGYFLGLITDGFSVTQRNKIKALDIDALFDMIVISEEYGTEKPNKVNYKVFHKFETNEYYYIGDNISKDFLTPNKLGWISICLLDNGKNIHLQNFNKEYKYLPQIKINKLANLKNIIK